jgi:hypothetical protein
MYFKYSDKLKEHIRFLVITFGINSQVLDQLIDMATDEVEVPNCDDCSHKRFHDDPKPSWA